MKLLSAIFQLRFSIALLFFMTLSFNNCSPKPFESQSLLFNSSSVPTELSRQGESFSCIGSFPSHSTICFGDDLGLTANAPRVLGDRCSNDKKCEFICNAGYNFEGNACILPRVNSCGPDPCQNGVNCSLRTGNPSSVSQTWVKGATDCGFICNSGYSGNFCEIAAAPNFTCQGQTPNNAILCSGDESDLISNLNVLVVNSCTNRKCEYTCLPGFNNNSGSCVPAQTNFTCPAIVPCTVGTQCTTVTGSPTSANFVWTKGATICGFNCTSEYEGDFCERQKPTNFSCLGSIPNDGLMCSNDDQGLTASLSRVVVNACTSDRKCEYLCVNGSNNVNGVCVRQTNSCSSNYPCTNGLNCLMTAGTPTQVNQSWIKGAGACSFSCIEPFEGDLCEKEKAPIITKVNESQPLVGVYYFGVFNSSFRSSYSNYIPNWPPEVQARPMIWWYGVEDLFNRTGSAYQEIMTKDPSFDPSNLRPEIGYYDNSEVSVVEKHINQASSNGIDYFNFYWYWSKSKKREVMQESLNAFKMASNKRKMKFQITIYLHPWEPDFNLTADDTPLAIGQIIEHIKDPQYLRIDGRPVFGIGDARNNRTGSLSDLHQLMGYIRDRFKRENLGDPIFMIQPAAITEWTNVLADATTCIVPSPQLITANSDYGAFVDDHPQFFNLLKSTGRPMSPCVASNFDERPRFKVFYNNYSQASYLSRFSFPKFQQSLKTALNETQIQNNALSNLINIYAWNEWHEGGIVEPNSATGTKFLETIEATLKSRSLNLLVNSEGRFTATTQTNLTGFTPVLSWKLFTEKKSNQLNKVAFYECRMTGQTANDRPFISTSANCEGQSFLASPNPIGFALRSTVGLKNDYVLLYRCNAGTFHFVHDREDCGRTPGKNYVNEGPLGFVTR